MRPCFQKEPRIKFRICIAILAITLLLVAAGFFAYPRYLAYRTNAHRQAFIANAAAANALFAEGHFDQAVPELKKLLTPPPTEIFPEVLAAYNNLATAQSGQGRFGEAQKTLLEAKALIAQVPEAELAKPEYRHEQVRIITGIANILSGEGKFKEAEKLYQQAVKLSPEDAPAHSNLANVYFIQGKPNDAQREFEMAFARDPKNPETLNNWGIFLLNVKQPADAEEKFRDALHINPKGAKYYYGLGLALRAQHRPGPALNELQNAIHHNPNYIEAFTEMGDVYFQLKDYHLAEDSLRGALSLDRNNSKAMLALARLLSVTDDLHQRDYLESAMLFKQASDQTHGQDVNLLTQTADMYALAGAYDRAVEIINTAVERAKEQHLSDVDMEILNEHALQYIFLQFPSSATPAAPNPLTTLGDPFGVNPKPVDPYDNPPPQTTAPVTVHPIEVPFIPQAGIPHK